MEAELRIAAVLSQRPRQPTTIRALSVLVGKSYSFTYTALQRMAKEGMVHLQVVGHAVLCTLQLPHPKVQALLVLAAAADQQQHIPHIALFSADGKQFVLCAEAQMRKWQQQYPKRHVVAEEQVHEWVSTIEFSSLTITNNAAYFWAVVSHG